MIKINIKDNLHNALTLKEIEWIPCTTFSAVPLNNIIKELNISFPEGHTDSEKITNIASIGYEYAGMEGITLPFDLCFEAEAMGCDVNLKNKDNSTQIINSPFNNIYDIEMPDDFISNARFPVLEKATKLLHEKYDDKEIPLIGSIIGPFTLLGQIYSAGVEGVLKHISNDVVSIEDALYSLTTGLLEEIELYNELGFDVITINEPNATPKLLEPHLFEQTLQPFLEELSESIKCSSVLHICGDTTSNLENMLNCGFNGLSIADNVNILSAKKLQAEINSPTRICGNISTDNLLSAKREKEVYEETLNTLSNGVDVLSPGCMIAPETPISNIKSMIKARDDFCDI